jgi:hypothetical protein
MLPACLAWGNIVSRSLPARYPPGLWPGQMRADMAAAFLDFTNTDEFVAAVKRGEAPPPSASRRRGKSTEPVWSRVYLERFTAPSIVSADEPHATENLETLV